MLLENFNSASEITVLAVCFTMLMLLTVAFCCGSPVNDCFRYFAPVAAAFPALLLMMPKQDPEALASTVPPEVYPCGGD